MSNLTALFNLADIALSMGDLETAKGCASDLLKMTWGTPLQSHGQEVISAIHERIAILSA